MGLGEGAEDVQEDDEEVGKEDGVGVGFLAGERGRDDVGRREEGGVGEEADQ